MENANGTTPTFDQETAQPAGPEPTVELTEEQELERLTQLHQARQTARVHGAQKAIAAICQQYHVKLVAQPQLVPDGRGGYNIVAGVAIAPLES